MPKQLRNRNIIFPLGGEFRAGGYAQKEPPFTTPRAVNVRGVGTFEGRDRGGSRPGLYDFLDVDFGTAITGIQKVAYVDDDGDLQVKLVVIADGNMNLVESSSRVTTVSYLTDESGNTITVGGDNIIFSSTVAAVNPLGNTDAFQMAEHDGKVYIADNVLREYEARSGYVRPVSAAPTGNQLVTVYRERVVLSGANHLVYFSRQGKPNDWNIGDDPLDIGRACIDYAGDNSVVGGAVTFQMAWGRNAFIFGHADGLYVIYGNPGGGGSKKTVSDSFGPIAPQAGCIVDGLFVFLSRNGLYSWNIGSNDQPNMLSSVVPEELKDVDVTANDIIMKYDKKNKGVHLFITPTIYNTGTVTVSGTTCTLTGGVWPTWLTADFAEASLVIGATTYSVTARTDDTHLKVSASGDVVGQAYTLLRDGSHWWIDLKYRALWPVKFALATHQPIAAGVLPLTGDSDVVLGCRDGYLRRFSNTSTTDDGTTITSSVGMGPLHISEENSMDGIITEISGDLADDSAAVTWALVPGKSAEEAVDAFDSDLTAGTTANVRGTGTWGERHNRPSYPRSRGPWSVLWLSSEGRWAYESVSLKTRKLGRLR